MSIVMDLDVVAKYVLQVNLVHQPKALDVLGSIQLWRKGGLFGTSDEMMKFCPANGCAGFFRDSFHMTKEEWEAMGDDAEDPQKWPDHLKERYSKWFQMPVMCPACGVFAIREDLPDSYGFRMSKDKVANKMAMFFDMLEQNADIYMVRSKNDREFHRARLELTGNQKEYRKMLNKARDRDSVYYGLKDILKDTATSASSTARFRSLLGA